MKSNWLKAIFLSVFIIGLAVTYAGDIFSVHETQYLILNPVSEVAIIYSYNMDSDYLDEWSASEQYGGCLYPVKTHNKAILFKTKEALHKYIETYECNGCIVMKISSSKTIIQTPITKKIETSVVDGYRFEIQ